MTTSKIPSTLPTLPPATLLPWSADVIEAHSGLISAFHTSRRALNLDESDPIWLGHHLKQAQTFMISIVNVLGLQQDNPLPAGHIEKIRESVELLIDGLQVAYKEATSV